MTTIYTIILALWAILLFIMFCLMMYLFFTEMVCFRFNETFYSEISKCNLTVEVIYTIPEAIEAKRHGNKLKLIGLF